MFLASISSSFLSFQFVRSGKANGRASLWTVSRVVRDMVTFYSQAKTLNLESEFFLRTIVHPRLYIFVTLFFSLETVNSPCFVRRLIVL